MGEDPEQQQDSDEDITMQLKAKQSARKSSKDDRKAKARKSIIGAKNEVVAVRAQADRKERARNSMVEAKVWISEKRANDTLQQEALVLDSEKHEAGKVKVYKKK